MASDSIHFSKIILRSNLHSIKIPNKFTRRYGSGLSNPVILKPPDGKEWKVYHQTKNDNEVWFQEGWTEFARFYSLDEGHLVLFKHEGTCQFDVHLFDKSALEIDYPSSKNFLSSDGDDDTAKIPYEIPSNRKFRRTTPLSSSRDDKKLRMENDFDQCQGTEFHKPTDSAELKFPKKESEEVKSRKRTCNLGKHQFMVKMKHAYIFSRSNLHLPSKFARTHLHDCTESIKLVVQDSAWHVKHVVRVSSQGTTIHEFSAADGWRRFRRDNNLKLGDICVFELIPDIKLAFQVTILRPPADPTNSGWSKNQI